MSGFKGNARPGLSEEAREFRERVIAACWVDQLGGYITEDSFIGRCPACGLWLAVRFHGATARADLDCDAGCNEDKILAAIAKAPA